MRALRMRLREAPVGYSRGSGCCQGEGTKVHGPGVCSHALRLMAGDQKWGVVTALVGSGLSGLGTFGRGTVVVGSP